MTAAHQSRFCPLVKCRALLETTVDRSGRATTFCPACARRRAHLCIDCNTPTTGKQWRCPVHQHNQRLRAGQIHHQRHLEAERAADRRRWHAYTPEQREHRRELRRLRDKKNSAEKAAKVKAWNAAHRIWYLAYHRRYNRRPGRAEAKRAQALRRYYELHPERPACECLVCGAGIEWGGQGRPRTMCPQHYAIVYPSRAAAA